MRGVVIAEHGERALDGDARLHAAVGHEKVVAAARRIQLHRQRHEGLRAPVVEIGGHDADHFVRLAVERDRTADQAGIAREAARPQAVREHDDLASVRLVLRFGEPAAERRLHLEHVHQRRGRPDGLHLNRIPLPREHEPRRRRSADGGEHLVPVLPVRVFRKRRRTGVARRLRVVDHDELFGLGIRQRLEKDVVEDAEYRRRHADAERERDNGKDADERTADARAHGVPKVLDESRHFFSGPLDGIPPAGVGRAPRTAHGTPHSSLSAVSGSTRVARQAGTQVAIRPVTNSSAATEANTAASRGPTSNSSCLIVPLSSAAMARPAAAPSTTSLMP